MKIFNNFDTNLKSREYEKSLQKFGKDSVLLVQRNFFYFFNKGLFPLFVYLFFLVGVGFLTYFFVKNLTVIYTIIGFFSFISLYIFYKIFNIYLDYKYDFSIFTPQKIFTFKQKGLFFSDYKDLPTSQIRSIVSGRSGILGNIFGYGKIKIYTDGGISGDKGPRSGAGRTRLSYVSKPNKLREEIWKICVGQDEKE